MTLEKTMTVLDDEIGEKTVVVDFNSNNACRQISFCVVKGSITIGGRFFDGDEEHLMGFKDLVTGEVANIADVGIFTLLGSEMLYSLTFCSEDETTVIVKFFY